MGVHDPGLEERRTTLSHADGILRSLQSSRKCWLAAMMVCDPCLERSTDWSMRSWGKFCSIAIQDEADFRAAVPRGQTSRRRHAETLREPAQKGLSSRQAAHSAAHSGLLPTHPERQDPA